ncbi:MAG: hypothetical protein ACYDAY_11880 [Candidatus Dormibacteria bacterium]
MAKKTKRRAAPAAQPRRQPDLPASAVPSRAAQPAAPAVPGATGGGDAVLRAVERGLAGGTRGRNVDYYADSAIPLDRVPYFMTDLRHISVVLVILLALLVGGGYFLLPILTR